MKNAFLFRRCSSPVSGIPIFQKISCSYIGKTNLQNGTPVENYFLFQRCPPSFIDVHPLLSMSTYQKIAASLKEQSMENAFLFHQCSAPVAGITIFQKFCVHVFG